MIFCEPVGEEHRPGFCNALSDCFEDVMKAIFCAPPTAQMASAKARKAKRAVHIALWLRFAEIVRQLEVRAAMDGSPADSVDASVLLACLVPLPSPQ